jgi:hypothetical protein
MEKLNEIKETYAKELGYKDWETCINDQPNYKVETLMDEVALRLYNVVGQSEQLQGFFKFYKQKFGGGFNTDVLETTLKQYQETL